MRGAKLAILGKQGAGKGTQAIRLARYYVIPHVSTGDIFRAAVKSGSQFGREAHKYMTAGELVPDGLVIGMVQERLGAADARERGFLLDGFPRTVAQAEALEDILAPEGLDIVVNLDVRTDVVLGRLAGRRVCQQCGTNYSLAQPPHADQTCDVCGGDVVQRDDDTEISIARRLALYEEQTNPLIAWYDSRNRLLSVHGEGSPDDVTTRLCQAVDDRLRQERVRLA